MLFNSLNFAIFLPIVFILYWFATKGNYKLQNILLLISSYFFYACWDWRFLFLLIFSTLLDYFTGIKIFEAPNRRKKVFWLWLSISINLGFLGVFKYYNFFAESFANGLSLLGFKPNIGTLNLILPVGISFYTFHGLSYVIDLYKNRIEPERNFINYSVFVSFFPLLVAGPIERATHLLPQIIKKRVFDYSNAVDGLRQILWGLFKKIVIADSCAIYVNFVFENSEAYSSFSHISAAILFAFQIYCDFSGYSDIALGTARLFGIELMKNFAFPYFSRDIAEFWRRWHISLSSWFKDYLYIPLGGSKEGMRVSIRNTFVIFLISGFWHGANWKFIVWGGLHALFFIPLLVFKKNRNNIDVVAKDKYLPNFKEAWAVILTFSLTTIAWVFFRSPDLTHALNFIKAMFVESEVLSQDLQISTLCILLVFFVSIEWLGRSHNYAIQNFMINTKWPYRWSFYILLVITIFNFIGANQQFIYFNF